MYVKTLDILCKHRETESQESVKQTLRAWLHCPLLNALQWIGAMCCSSGEWKKEAENSSQNASQVMCRA